MNRLTKEYDVITAIDKDGTETHSKSIDVKDRYLADKKLFEIENIEEELGIDLVTLFKALKNGVFIKECQIVFKTVDLLRIGNEFYLVVLYAGNYHLKDYGKTWALTREELI